MGQILGLLNYEKLSCKEVSKPKERGMQGRVPSCRELQDAELAGKSRVADRQMSTAVCCNGAAFNLT